jgi:hypothetical protein
MTKEKNNRSVTGEWFGNYYYSGASQAFGFEAVFVEAKGSVEGHILDEGQHGEAKVAGSFAYPTLAFTKVYRRGYEPVKYIGTISEDVNSLTGTWVINQQCSGTWAAWRSSEDGDEDIREFDKKQPIEREEQHQEEKERNRPLVAPARAK